MRSAWTAKTGWVVLLIASLAGACAAPLKTTAPSFRLPSEYRSFIRWEGLEVAIDPIDTVEKSNAIFGTDMWEAMVLPLHLIVRNTGSHEFEIAAVQIFGVTRGGELANSYTLDQAAVRVRESSIGTTAATGALVGGIAGAAAGAAIGGAIAGGRGAGTGAAVGAATGGVVGTAEGTSDSIAHRFRRELAAQDFGNRVIRPGYIEQGFLYMKWAQYESVRLLLFDITTNKRQEISVPIGVVRPPKTNP